MNIKYPISFGILIATLVLTALLTVAIHNLLAWLAVFNLGLIVLLRFTSHSETTDGIVARLNGYFSKNSVMPTD
jgi:hypothetical protein